MDIELWRERKKALGLTLDEIADQAGVSRGTVARIFSKTNSYDNPERVTIEAIERVLGLSGDQLPVATAPTLSEMEQRLLAAFNSLVPSMQEYILEMTEGLVDKQQGVQTVGQKPKRA